MNSSNSPTVLVLGANGMLGHTVFHYLSKHFKTLGTVKSNPKKESQFIFEAADSLLLDKTFKQNKIQYIINCIGILRQDSNKEEMQSINATFPQKLKSLAEKYNAKLIHVSTDAVFAPNVYEVTEKDYPSPIDVYGKTKLLGEPKSPNAITMRTSLLGLDPIHHKGLLEFILQEEHITGYTNQLWSGATTLQFAKLCQQIIVNNSFSTMKKKASVFHFAPLTHVSKYDIIKSFLELNKDNKQVKKTLGQSVTRLLKTNYPEQLYLDTFQTNISEALKELIKFEKS